MAFNQNDIHTEEFENFYSKLMGEYASLLSLGVSPQEAQEILGCNKSMLEMLPEDKLEELIVLKEILSISGSAAKSYETYFDFIEDYPLIKLIYGM